jgi:myo-inositol-1(or 4)-monophosphatase
LDGYYETVKPWDIAAGGLILREAGGEIGFLNGEPGPADVPRDLYSVELVGATPGILAKLMELLRTA